MSAMVCSEGIVEGAGDAAAVSDGDGLGTLVAVGTIGAAGTASSCLSSGTRLGACCGTGTGTGAGAGVGCWAGLCGVVVGSKGSADDGKESFPGTGSVSSALESRFVALNQLTGRTRVLVCS